jgi:hypothetical protein
MPDALRSALYLELAISHGAAMGHIGQVSRELSKLEQQVSSLGAMPIAPRGITSAGMGMHSMRSGVRGLIGDYENLSVSAEEAMRGIDQLSHGIKKGLWLHERLKFSTDGYRRSVVTLKDWLERMSKAEFNRMDPQYQEKARDIYKMGKAIDATTGHVKNLGLEMLAHVPVIGQFFETARSGAGALLRFVGLGFVGKMVKEGYDLVEMQDHFSKANFRGTMSIRQWSDTIRGVRKDSYASQRDAIEITDALSGLGMTAGKTSEEIRGMASEIAKEHRITGVDAQTLAGLAKMYERAGLSSQQWGLKMNDLRKIQQGLQIDSKNMASALQMATQDQDSLEDAMGVGAEGIDEYAKSMTALAAISSKGPNARSFEKELDIIHRWQNSMATIDMSKVNSPFEMQQLKIRNDSNDDMGKEIEGNLRLFSNYQKTLEEYWNPKTSARKKGAMRTMLPDIFGPTNLAMSRIAYNAMHAEGGIEGVIKKMNEAKDATADKTNVDDALAKTTDTLKGALDKLNSKGADLQGGLEGPVGMMQHFIESVDAFIGNHPWLAKAGIIGSAVIMGHGLISGLVGGGIRMLSGFKANGLKGGLGGFFGGLFGFGGGGAAGGGAAVAKGMSTVGRAAIAEAGAVARVARVGGGIASKVGRFAGAFGKAAGFGLKFLKVAGPIGLALDLIMNHGEAVDKLIDGLIGGIGKLADAALDASAKLVGAIGTAGSEVIEGTGHVIGGTLHAIGDAAVGAGKALWGLGTRVARWGAGEADTMDVINALMNPTFVEGIKMLGSLKMDNINKEFENLGNAINCFRYVDEDALNNLQRFGKIFSNLFGDMSGVGDSYADVMKGFIGGSSEMANGIGAGTQRGALAQTLYAMRSIADSLPVVQKIVDLMASIGGSKFADTMSLYGSSMGNFASVVRDASAALDVFEAKRKDMDADISQIVKGYGTVVNKLAEKSAEAIQQAAEVIVAKLENVYQKENKERIAIKDILSDMRNHDGGSVGLGNLAPSWRR